MNKKIALAILVVFLVVGCLSFFGIGSTASAEGIYDSITGGGGFNLDDPQSSELGQTLDQTAGHIVNFLQFVLVIFCVVMVVLVAFTLIGGTDERSIAMVKRRAIYIVVALFVIFQAQNIVGFVVNMFATMGG